LYGHQGLEQDGTRHVRSLLHGHGSGDLERHFRGVDVVIAPIGQAHAHVYHGISGQDSRGQRLGDALVDRSDVLLGDHTTGDLVDELVATTGAGGLEGYDDVTVLTLTTGLLHELQFDLLDLLTNGLAVGHLGLTDVGVHGELAQHAVDQ